MCDHHKLDAINLLAAAIRDASDHWCDENWPYGPDRIGFSEKHAKAIEVANNILK